MLRASATARHRDGPTRSPVVRSWWRATAASRRRRERAGPAGAVPGAQTGVGTCTTRPPHSRDVSAGSRSLSIGCVASVRQKAVPESTAASKSWMNACWNTGGPIRSIPSMRQRGDAVRRLRRAPRRSERSATPIARPSSGPFQCVSDAPAAAGSPAVASGSRRRTTSGRGETMTSGPSRPGGSLHSSPANRRSAKSTSVSAVGRSAAARRRAAGAAACEARTDRDADAAMGTSPLPTPASLPRICEPAEDSRVGRRRKGSCVLVAR